MTNEPTKMMTFDTDKAAEFLRRHGHSAGDMIPAETVYQYLKDYTEWLEVMCNQYAKIANQALNLQLPEPFVIKAGAEK